MPEISAILFDVGNVLLKLKTQEFLAKVEAASPGLNREAMLAELKQEGSVHHAYERGQVKGQDFHAHLQKRYGLPWDYETWLVIWTDYFTLNKPMELMLARLKGQVRFFALSNTNAEHYAYFKRQYRLFDAFEEVLGSHLHAARKPEPAFYQAALKRIGGPAARVLFLDDVKEFVEAARREGMQGFHYTFNDPEFQERLKSLGLELKSLDGHSSMNC